jgi:hypothetical protein
MKSAGFERRFGRARRLWVRNGFGLYGGGEAHNPVGAIGASL